MVVGFVPLAYWAKTKSVKAFPFVLGGTLWFAAIIPKVVLDLTMGEALDLWANSTLGALGAFIFISAYVGFRTGAFESGLSYIAFLKTRLGSATYDDAVGFGLAFGGVEAILLGLSSFLNVLLFLLNPSLIEQVPAAQRQALLNALDAPSIMVFAPIIERTFTIFVHLFATVLVYLAVLRRKASLFWVSLLYRAGIDGMVPGFGRVLVQPYDPVLMTYMIEFVIAIYGSVGLLATRWLGRKMETNGVRTTETRP